MLLGKNGSTFVASKAVLALGNFGPGDPPVKEHRFYESAVRGMPATRRGSIREDVSGAHLPGRLAAKPRMAARRGGVAQRNSVSPPTSSTSRWPRAWNSRSRKIWRPSCNNKRAPGGLSRIEAIPGST